MPNEKLISIGFVFKNGEEDVRNTLVCPVDNFEPDVWVHKIKPEKEYGWVIIRRVER